jgi:putative membrane protein
MNIAVITITSARVGKLKGALAASLVAIAACGVTALTAGRVMAADTGLSQHDREFMGKAAQGGLMEVAAGKLAAKRGQNPSVRAFGQQMVTDHTAANEMLKSLADSKQMTVLDTVAPQEQAALGRLEGLNGIAFDQAYASLMVKDHVADIQEFEKEAKSGQDPDVKAFAAQTLPTLRHHLMLANQLSSQQNKSPSPRPAS